MNYKKSILLVSNLLVVLALLMFPSSSVYPQTIPSMVVYGEAGVNPPRFRLWDGSAWSNEANALPGASSPSEVVLKANPIKNERVLGVVGTDRRLNLQIWNGLSWGNPVLATLSSGVVSNPSRSFDIAYEQQSGKALVVYGETGSMFPRFRIWNGNAWSPLPTEPARTVPVTKTSGVPVWIRLEPRPNSDEILFVYQDTNNDISALVWNGIGFSQEELLETQAFSTISQAFDIAYEQRSCSELRPSCDGLVVWAISGNPFPQFRTWNGAAWSAKRQAGISGIDSSATLNFVRLAADPSSDQMALGTSDSNSDLVVQIWDGASWPSLGTGSPFQVSSDLSFTTYQRAFDLAWERFTGKLIALFGVSNPSGVFFRSWTSAFGWSDQSAYGGLQPTILAAVVQMQSNPNANEILAGVLDTSNGISLQRWNGVSWVNFTNIETNSSGIGNVIDQETGTLTTVYPENFMLSYSQQFIPSHPLTVISANPDILSQGTTGRTVVINGNGFLPGARVTFSGAGITQAGTLNTTVPTTCLPSDNSCDQLSVRIDIAPLATPGSRDITVTNPAPDSRQATGVGIFRVKQEPTIIGTRCGSSPVRSPCRLGQGAVNQTMIITGQNFTSGAVVTLGLGVSTIVDSVTLDGTQISSRVTVGIGANPGKRAVTVQNNNGQVNSGLQLFEITPGPFISTVNPSSLPVNSVNQLLTITGGNFQEGAMLNLEGAVPLRQATTNLLSVFSPENMTLSDPAKIEVANGAIQLKVVGSEITPDASTVGLWHFNESGGTTAADSSGNGNTGVYTNTFSDGFESGSLSGYTMSGNVGWEISTTAFQGTFSAKSGSSIGNSQTSRMSKTLTFSSNGSISFYEKISSEAGLDFGRLYIDGVRQAAISGSVNWRLRTFSVTAGTHTFMWEYATDVSLFVGDNSYWIDNIQASPVVSGPTQTADGKFNRALSFDGRDNYIRIPFSSSLNLNSSDFTMEVWFNADSGFTGSQRNILQQMDSGGTGRDLLYLAPTTGEIQSLFGGAVRGTGVMAEAGQWHQAAIVHKKSDGTNNFSIYVDGILRYGPTPVVHEGSSGDYLVGIFKDLGSRGFLGRIDEVAIQRRALSGNEILAHRGLYSTEFVSVTTPSFGGGTNLLGWDRVVVGLTGTETDGTIQVSYSTDNGVSFSAPQIVTSNNPEVLLTGVPAVAIIFKIDLKSANGVSKRDVTSFQLIAQNNPCSVESSTHMLCLVTLSSSATVGIQNITVTNPDGGVSLPKSITITPPVNPPSTIISSNTQLGCSDPLVYQNLTVTSGAILTLTCDQTPLIVNGTLRVESPSQIVADPVDTFITVRAGDLIIQSGAKIQADGKGCATDEGYDTSGARCSGSAPGRGTNGGGGGYGGSGGNSGGSPPSTNPLLVPGPGGSSYAEATARTPIEQGSGGGRTSQGSGGAGGGAIRLEVIGTLTLDGTISAVGQSGPTAADFGPGGGSGGSISVTAERLAGGGSFVAAGGSGGTCSTSGITNFSGGGGAGGRIGIKLAGFSTFAGRFNAGGGLGGVQGNPQCGVGKAGAPGTLFFSDPGTSTALILSGNVRLPFDQTFTSLTIPKNMELDLSDGVKLTLNNSTSFEGTIKVIGSSQIKALGNFTVPKLPDGTSASISADETGCAGGTGFEFGTVQCTSTAAGRGNNGSGGGYGGEGGSSGGGAPGGKSYGSAILPAELGSGGGGSGNPPAGGAGGAGGGAIGLEVLGTLTVDGVISSKGQAGTNANDFGAGGGSGGSIHVTADHVTGSGSFAAVGGSGGGCLTSGITNFSGGGGGGGRIAIYTPDTSGFIGNLNAFGGPVGIKGNPSCRTARAGAIGTASFNPVDIFPPAPITDLLVIGITSNSIDLGWTATGDDGSTGTASSYDLRDANTPITDDPQFNIAIQLVGEPTPRVAGTPQTFRATGLARDTLYCFAIKVIDDAGNTSALNLNVPVCATTQPLDTTSPSSVSDLATGTITSNSVQLLWTPVGDDGTSGRVSQYDLRYTTAGPITEATFVSATAVIGVPITQPGGSSTQESFSVAGLVPELTYYFAIKACDEVPNCSGINSNGPVSARVPLPDNPPDTTAPQPITDLRASISSINSSSLVVEWTAQRDDFLHGRDGLLGTADDEPENATAFELRYSTFPIDDSNFANSFLVSGLPPPGPPGSLHTFKVNGLRSNTTYHFAIKAVDEAGNRSGLSNCPAPLPAGTACPPVRTALRIGSNLVSVPTQPQPPTNTADAVFGDDVGIAVNLLRWNSNSTAIDDGAFDNLGSTSIGGTNGPVQAGRGYFLFSRGNLAIMDADSTNALDVVTSTYEVPLDPQGGFNMIANPYRIPVRLQDTCIRVSGSPSISFVQAINSNLVDNALYLWRDDQDSYTFGTINLNNLNDPNNPVLSPWKGYGIRMNVAGAYSIIFKNSASVFCP